MSETTRGRGARGSRLSLLVKHIYRSWLVRQVGKFQASERGSEVITLIILGLNSFLTHARCFISHDQLVAFLPLSLVGGPLPQGVWPHASPSRDCGSSAKFHPFRGLRLYAHCDGCKQEGTQGVYATQQRVITSLFPLSLSPSTVCPLQAKELYIPGVFVTARAGDSLVAANNNNNGQDGKGMGPLTVTFEPDNAIGRAWGALGATQWPNDLLEARVLARQLRVRPETTTRNKTKRPSHSRA